MNFEINAVLRLFETFTVFDISILIGVFLISAVLCWVIVRHPTRFLIEQNMQADTKAKQSVHDLPTPRVGGAALLIAFAIGIILFQAQISGPVLLALAAGLVVFIVGLREDIWRDMAPKYRLLAAFISAGLAVLLSSYMVPGLGLTGIDTIFKITLMPLLVTLVWSAGACNAVNLIDGLNGFSSSYSIVAGVGFFFIAGAAGEAELQLVSLTLIMALAGFFIFNWPLGRIFLGDAGAYAVGHILAWCGIILLARSSDVSGSAILLILFWPVADTLFSIIRRKLRRQATDRPDQLHFHHLVMRALRLKLDGKISPKSTNSLATVLLLPLYSAPVLCGVIFWNQSLMASIALLVFALLFVTSYVFIMDAISHRWNRWGGERGKKS